jgi:hypothetical protein
MVGYIYHVIFSPLLKGLKTPKLKMYGEEEPRD